MKIYVIECGRDTGRSYDITTGFKNVTVSDGYNCKFRTKEQIEKEVKTHGKCILRCMTSGQLTITVKYDSNRKEVINEGVQNSNCSGIIIK